MKIFDRLCLMVRADAHGIMDQLEERALLIKQELREAEIALDEKRARADSLDAALRALAREAEGLEEAIARFDRDIGLALERGEEALARFTIRRLLPRREALRANVARRTRIADDRRRLAEALQSDEATLDDLRTRARARLAELAREDCTPAPEMPAVADEDVEIELLRRRSASEDASLGQEATR